MAPLPEEAPYTTKIDGDRLFVESEALGSVAAIEATGRRIREVGGGQGALSLTMAPNTRRRLWRTGGRLVIDIYEAPSKPPEAGTQSPKTQPAISRPLATARAPVSPSASGAAGVPPPASPGSATTHRLPASRPPARTQPAAGLMDHPAPGQIAPALRAAPSPQPSAPPETAAAPVQERSAATSLAGPATPPQGAVLLQPADDDYPNGSLLIQASQEVGAAAFARNGMAHVVFDAALPLDLAALKGDPAYGGITAEPLAAATHLLLKPPPGMILRLARQKEGWRLGFSRQSVPQEAITILPQAGGLLLAAQAGAATLVVDDRQAGATLLVGTQRKGAAHVVAGHRTPEFMLPATWLGVVVDALSDRLELRAGTKGFLLRMGSGPAMATAWPGSAEAAASEVAGLTRRFDLPDLPVPMLRTRLHDAMRDEALAPKLARYDARVRTAQAMLALGLDLEAFALLRVAASDDPAADALDGGALRAVAAGLAGRQEAPAGPDERSPVSLSGQTDEDAFWRAFLQPGQPSDPQTAATLATTWKLALTYPEPLRRAILPRLGGLLLKGGKAAAAELVKAAADPELDLVRAELAQANGQVDAALAGYDKLAGGTDRDLRAQARRAAVDLRLAQKRMTAKEAAQALQAQVFAWRGDDRELDLRIRAAQVLKQAGAWRAALGGLREAERLYPQAHDRLREAQASVVGDLLKQDTAALLPPLELVALVGECADLLGQSPAGALLAPILVDKLLALDLPDRAEPILRRMIQASPPGAPKAELGLRLAELLLGKADAAGAATALEQTAPGEGDKPPAGEQLEQRRLMVKARLLASIGDSGGALRLLAKSESQEALDLKAGLLERARDWAGAMRVLDRLVEERAGGAGKLSTTQAELVLRYASDAAQAGDAATLRTLRERDLARIPSGAQADLLRVLTQSPVRAVDDLPRASQELAAARVLPASLVPAQLR